ncbi:MAG: P-loop NTPase [Lachnospiraceae bacterium]
MSENCNNDCGSCSKSCSDRTKPNSFPVAPHELSQVKKVIAVVSGKGGVGKSFVTAMLGARMRKKGYQTAILDADITGPSIPKVFGVDQKAEGDESGIYPVNSSTGIKLMSMNLLLENANDPVVWRGPIIAGTVKQFWSEVIWQDVDYMFVDMPPGTGDVPLTVLQSLPLAGIIVVTSPQELVSMIVEKAVKMAGMMNVPVLGIVENMAYFECPNCKEKHYLFGQSHVQELAQQYDIKNVAQIPMKPENAVLCDEGKAEEIDAAWLEELCKALEEL